MAAVVWAALAVVIIGVPALYFGMTAAKKGADWVAQYQFAHRGLHDKIRPENSIPAFEAAVNNGYAVELDVRLSKDGAVMVFHDDDLKRATGRDGTVENHTAEELRALRLFGTDCPIPTLEEALAHIDGKTPVLVELKNTGKAGELEKKTAQILKEYKGLYAVQSFSPFSMGWFAKEMRDVPRGQLSGTFIGYGTSFPAYQRFMMRHLWINFLSKPNFINYDLDGLEYPVVKRLKKRGIPILAWTVRNKKDLQKARRFADAPVFENLLP